MAAERIVLDASVAVEWFLPAGGPSQRYAEGILERISAGELFPAVPDLWHYELGSVLVAAKRDKRISDRIFKKCSTLFRVPSPVFPAL